MCSRRGRPPVPQSTCSTIALEQKQPARADRLLHACENGFPMLRRQELNEYRDHHVVRRARSSPTHGCRRADGPRERRGALPGAWPSPRHWARNRTPLPRARAPREIRCCGPLHRRRTERIDPRADSAHGFAGTHWAPRRSGSPRARIARSTFLQWIVEPVIGMLSNRPRTGADRHARVRVSTAASGRNLADQIRSVGLPGMPRLVRAAFARAVLNGVP